MNEIAKLDSISQFNTIRGVETRHPLISVFDNQDSAVKNMPDGRYHYGLYAIYLKEVICGEMTYGRNKYDYDIGTLVFIAPGQIVGIKTIPDYESKGKVLAFHPDFIKGTSLARKMSSYSFFSYEMNEALHLSERERKIIIDLYDKIDYELEQSIDKHSKSIIINNIETLLNYGLRFYDRQFVTRENLNKGLLSDFEHLLDNYFESEKPQTIGLPSVAYFAEKLHLSTNYFGDLVRKETGKTALDYVHTKLIDVAKTKIFDTSKTISQVAYELGFQYPQHFSRLFKNETGYTPNDYRNSMLN